MTITAPLDSASSWLTWSNIVYVGGAVLTLAAAMHVLYEKRAFASGKRTKESFLSEALVLVAATVSLIGTIGAIHFGSVVSKLKDDELAQYKKGADLNIAQLTKDAATANQKAQEARDRAEATSNANAKLQIEVSRNATKAEKAEAALSKQNQETYNYAHALAQQQAIMSEQAHVSPILTDFQIETLANQLRPFSGSDVGLRSTSDTTVLRLKQSIAVALNKAGLTFKANNIDMGALYQGVSVAVHSPQDVPPLANTLVQELRNAGIDVHPVSLNSVPAGQVAIYLGPN
jgi:hypothetical protein